MLRPLRSLRPLCSSHLLLSAHSLRPFSTTRITLRSTQWELLLFQRIHCLNQIIDLEAHRCVQNAFLRQRDPHHSHLHREQKRARHQHDSHSFIFKKPQTSRRNATHFGKLRSEVEWDCEARLHSNETRHSWAQIRCHWFQTLNWCCLQRSNASCFQRGRHGYHGRLPKWSKNSKTLHRYQYDSQPLNRIWQVHGEVWAWEKCLIFKGQEEERCRWYLAWFRKNCLNNI